MKNRMQDINKRIQNSAITPLTPMEAYRQAAEDRDYLFNIIKDQVFRNFLNGKESDLANFVIDGEYFLFGAEAIRHLEDKIENLEDQVHYCPDCKMYCKECNCVMEKMDIFREALEYIANYSDPDFPLEDSEKEMSRLYNTIVLFRRMAIRALDEVENYSYSDD